MVQFPWASEKLGLDVATFQNIAGIQEYAVDLLQEWHWRQAQRRCA
jgi:hypothetical protein